MANNTKKHIKSEYFDYNNIRYYIGTRFTMKYKNTYVVAHFTGRSNTDKKNIEILIENGLKHSTMVSIKENDFLNMIINIMPINWHDEMEFRKKYIKDFDMPELIIGWMIYIFIMVGSSIFNGRECAWILITILFFWWRYKQKGKNGVYYDKKG